MIFRLSCLIFLIGLINSRLAVGYKCEFSEIDGYTCKIYSNSWITEDVHNPGKSDDDVTRVVIDNSWLGTDHVAEVEFPICERFKSLQWLKIKRELKSVDGNLLRNCENLEKMVIKSTDIREIPENLFSENSKLTGVDMKVNVFITLPPNIFKPLKKLQILNLNTNSIRALNPAWLESLTNLRKFSAAGNKISELPKNVFTSLENLEELHLWSNQLTTIHSDSFGVHSKLTKIDLSYNRINAIDEKLIKNTAVSELDMNGNVCSKENITEREEMKKKLKKCFENYQPRED